MEFVEEGADSVKKVRGFYRAQKYLWNGDILFFGIRPPGGSPHQDLYDDRSSKLQEQGRKSHRKDGLGWAILQREHRPGADVPQAGVARGEAAAQLGRSPSALANKLRLLRLSPACRELLVENGLTERHARCRRRLEDEEERLVALGHIADKHLNVAQTEQYIEKRLAALQSTAPKRRRTFILKDVRLFPHRLGRGLRLVREAGVKARSERQETEDAILLTIRIPKQRQTS